MSVVCLFISIFYFYINIWIEGLFPICMADGYKRHHKAGHVKRGKRKKRKKEEVLKKMRGTIEGFLK